MRVLLADDHALFRAGIASLLRAWAFEVVGEAGDGLAALEQARLLRPDLILMDIEMPDCDGLAAARLIKDELPACRIVIVTVSDDDESLFQAIKSGADGYLLKDMSEEDLRRTLTAVVAGEPALSPVLAARILDEFARLSRGGTAKENGSLTPREREVLGHIASGATNKETAAALFVTEVIPGPTNPWGGKTAKVAFYVETLTSGKGESVWGASAGKGCVRTNYFPRRERVVFHIMAWDAKSGRTIEPVDIKYAYMKIPGLPNQKLKYGPHGKDPKTAPWTWYLAWDVPPDYPLGIVNYELVVKTKTMTHKGEIATFRELPLAPEQLTIVESRPQL